MSTKIGTELGKKAIQVGVMSVSGVVNNVVTKKITNEEITVSNCLTGAVVSAVGASAGMSCFKTTNTSVV